jgi:lactoylglutathione lyase
MELAHVALSVSDLDRALEFYGELGFEETHRFTLSGVENVYIAADDSEDDGAIATESSDSASGDEGAASTDGALQLRYDDSRTTPIAPSRADHDHIAFTVDDVEATFEAALDAGGAAVLEPTEIEPADAYAAFVEDPEGYTVEFYRGL